MGQDHGIGAIYGTRQGSLQTIHTIPYNYTDFTTAVAVLQINASATKPVLAEFGNATGTAFTGTTPKLDVGTTLLTPTEFLSGVTPASAAQGAMSTTLRLLVADTVVYIKTRGGAQATQVLTISATTGANTQTVTIGGKVYTFLTSLVDAANNVLIGASATAMGDNLVAAIMGTAGAGTTYGTGTVVNAYWTAVNVTGTVTLTAIEYGPVTGGANSETLTNSAFGSLTDGTSITAGAGFVIAKLYEANVVVGAANQ